MKTLVTFALLSVSLSGFAQGLEGVVYYDQKVDMHRRLAGQNAELKAMIPQFNTNKFMLMVKGSESIFKTVPKEQEPDAQDNGGVVIRMQVPQNEVYKNTDKAQRIELRDFFGKKFLIEDSLRQMPWKLSGESKKILGYDCLKATMVDAAKKQNIVGWFTDAVAAATGPEVFSGLPGLLLEIDINEGENVFVATKIDARPLKAEELKTPAGGKKVTQAEYKKIVEERMKEMGGQTGPGGGTVMKIIRN